MKVVVNGKERAFEGGSLEALIEELGAAQRRAAVLLNGEVVPAAEWASVRPSEGDRIEVVVFVGGG